MGVKKAIIGIYTLAFALCYNQTEAQEFIGLNSIQQSGIQHIPYNPAYVNSSDDGIEIMLFSGNALAGNNAYYFRKKFVLDGFNGQAFEGKDYFRDLQQVKKHLWANLDIRGPAVSFTYKKEHHFGLYTRLRQIHRAGNVSSTVLNLLGNSTPELYYGQNVSLENVGYTTHTFAEVGVSYGRILYDDYYHIFKGGFTLKYLMGFVAGSAYTDGLDYNQKSADSIASIKGNLNAFYTHNIDAFIDTNAQNDLSSWNQRAGRWGLGLDIGVQYEYHPNGNPNEETPYLYRLSASITDLGGIGYVADTGSGTYDIAINDIDTSQYIKRGFENLNWYMLRMQNDTNINVNNTSNAAKFRVGLPTALRLNADYNATKSLNLAVNILLNLRGNSKTVYRASYVNYINFTPSIGNKTFRFGMPFTIMGYQTLAIGATIKAGPLYIGSTSAASLLLVSRIKNIDAYAGLAIKLKSKKKRNKYLY